VRTDLDSFSDIEAYSLMLDGYRMSAPELEKMRATLRADGVPEDKRARGPKDWAFLRVAPWAESAKSAAYLEHLKVAGQRFFKPFRLDKWLMALGLVLLAAALAGLYVLLREQILWLLQRPLWSLLLVLGIAALAWFAPALRRMFEVLRYIRSPLEMVTRFVGMLGVALLGALTVRLYLATIDRLFLWLGKVERLK